MKTQKILEELEAAGVVVRTGGMRPNRNGKLEPVYVIAPQYRNDPEAADKVLERLAEFDKKAAGSA